MIEHGKTLISDDIKEKHFVCDLSKCKGACCVEGDLGAPLEKEELSVLDEIYEKVEPYLSTEGRNAIKAQGKYILDQEGDFSTPTINGNECAYAVYDKEKVLKCGIEQAWIDKKINFKKPISCHLYPIRITKYEALDALNYDQWSICSDACSLGEKLKVPVYEFLEEALTRKYGAKWYSDLVIKIKEKEKDIIPT